MALSKEPREYRAGFTECSDCHVPLVWEPADSKDAAQQQRALLSNPNLQISTVLTGFVVLLFSFLLVLFSVVNPSAISTRVPSPAQTLIRSLESPHMRGLFFGLVLLAGCLGGMAMRPEEIEELLSTMNAQKIVQVAEEPGLPPID